MWALAWLVAGAAWGGVCALLIWPRPSGSLLGDLAARFLARQIGRLDMEQRKHLEMAGVRVESVVRWMAAVAFIAVMVLALLLVAGMGFGLLGFLLAVLLGAVLGWTVPMWATVGPYKTWQRKVSVGIPAFVTYLPVYLRAGDTPRKAMERAAALAPEPFRGVMQSTLDTVKRLGSTEAAFDSLAARVGIPELDQVLIRLGTLWNQQINPDVLGNMDAEFDAVREIAVARSLAAGKAQMMGAAFVLALGWISLAMGSLAQYLLAHSGMLLHI